MKVLGIDIGGSSLKAAPVETASGRLLDERYRVPTPDKLTPRQMARVVADIVAHFGWRGPVGIGFPGVIHGSRILSAGNLDQAFIGCDGGKLFGKAAGRPVGLINDAAAAALAEMKFGAGRDFSGKTLLLTLGTGVGSALGYQGVVVPCEFGHLQFKGDDAEKYVAASVKVAEDLSWSEWGGRLSKFIAILERALWPELIIIGGGVSAKHRKFFKHIEHRARMVPAQFLNEAGIVGAALWAAGRK